MFRWVGADMDSPAQPVARASVRFYVIINLGYLVLLYQFVKISTKNKQTQTYSIAWRASVKTLFLYKVLYI